MPNIIQNLIQTQEITAVCGGADILRLLRFVLRLLDIICIIVPTVLIVMIAIDIGKNVIAGNEEAMSKNLQLAIKRIIMCCVLFLVPVFVSVAMNLVSEVTKKMGGKSYIECFNIAKGNSDLSEHEIKWPEPTKATEEDNQLHRPGAHATIPQKQSESEDGGSGNSDSGGGGGGGESSNNDGGDSGGDSSGDDSPSDSTAKSIIYIGDSLASSIRDVSGTSAGAIDLIPSSGDINNTLTSETTISKVSAAAKKDNCTILIAAYVTTIRNTAGASRVKSSIEKLRTDAKADKCKFVVISVPPVDQRAKRQSSAYTNDKIKQINATLRTSSRNYCNISDSLKMACNNECQQNAGTGVKLNNIDGCNSNCFNETGINFSALGYTKFYTYVKQCL